MFLIFYFKLIFFNYFNILILKIIFLKINYFNIFLNKKNILKNNGNYTFKHVRMHVIARNPKLIAIRNLRKFNAITIKLALLLRGIVDY